MCAALALTITTAGAAEPDYQSANYWLRGCKAVDGHNSSNDGVSFRSYQEAYNGGFCRGEVYALVFVMKGLFADQRICMDIPERHGRAGSARCRPLHRGAT